ncbi:patatin-like phospholipase family protein [Antarcticibacterium sp. 1MA-6-2]|uniref:patatin-like phospholipase family protein n=1 Tax=Antarcticibacterium sp. 1MA-6-2 TaxID=2908210 RepID=UPI001F24EA8A|nr:patatin-like phospholipase family protein [Antarcticibacterium sp. 1MA-6-2]UJH91402.1 patatin-like phospholipase family protein [Antarcticibacterium sp. 1MA-6-2]
MKKILSIDGGGIRGIIPGQILVTMERKLQKKSGDPEARLADYFDFFAGTSTGGILTCICLCPSEKDPFKAKFSAQEAVNLYMNHGEEIFSVNLWQKIKAANGYLDEKYKEDALEKYLRKYFGDLKISELIKPCIIPSYDIDRRSAYFFAQHDPAIKGEGRDFLVRDACRATSAAPTYFEAAIVKSCSGVTYPLIDGGVYANNPSLCAYSEVRNAKDNPTAAEMFMVSLGTSSKHQSYKYTRAKNWGAVGWIKPLIDIMMSGAAETTHYHLSRMFSARNKANSYIRIQPSSLGNADVDMDNASKENLAALAQVGVETSESCSDELDRIVEVLLQGPDPVEFA